MTFSNGRSCELAVHCVNNLLRFYGFVIFCLCVAASGPSFCSHAGAQQGQHPRRVPPGFFECLSPVQAPFLPLSLKEWTLFWVSTPRLPHFCPLFGGFSSVFHAFSCPGFPLSPLPQVTARTDESFLQKNIKGISIPMLKRWVFSLLCSPPSYIMGYDSATHITTTTRGARYGSAWTKDNKIGTIMRTECPQSERGSFPNGSQQARAGLDFAGFMLYYSCGCRWLVLSRAVKPTPFPTISGFINFTLLFFLIHLLF